MGTKKKKSKPKKKSIIKKITISVLVLSRKIKRIERKAYILGYHRGIRDSQDNDDDSVSNSYLDNYDDDYNNESDDPWND